MSRNLLRTNCYGCRGSHEDIVLDEKPRPVTASDTGDRMFLEYCGLIVAKAHCRLCHALYLAWVDWPGNPYWNLWPGNPYWNLSKENDRRGDNEKIRFVDLSFQHSFNDEPSPLDTPLYVVETVVSYRRRPAISEEHSYRRVYDDWTTQQVDAWKKRQDAELARKFSLADEGVREAGGDFEDGAMLWRNGRE